MEPEQKQSSAQDARETLALHPTPWVYDANRGYIRSASGIKIAEAFTDGVGTLIVAAVNGVGPLLLRDWPKKLDKPENGDVDPAGEARG